MSYILDALRRADAERERERGASPGLHSTSRLLPELGEADDAPVVPPLPFARLVIGALVLGLAGAAVWWFLQRGPSEPTPMATTPMQAPLPPSAQASLPPMTDPATAAASKVEAGPAAPVAPGVAGLPGAVGMAAAPNASGGMGPVPAGAPPTPVPPVMAPLPTMLPDPPGRRPPSPEPNAAPIQPQLPGQGPAAAVRPPRPTAAVPLSPPQAPTSPRAESPTRAQPAPAIAAAPATEAAPMRWRDLPESLRRELPSLSLGGSMYSPQPGSRMVVLDGQVFREGQAVAPGLTLEQIGPRSAILAYKGQRFELPF